MPDDILTFEHRHFLNPSCTPGTLDTFIVRQAILAALRSHLSEFGGTLLDVGCGHQPYKPLLTKAPSRVQAYIGLDVANGAYSTPDLLWDGMTAPLKDDSVDCALATEVFEHCPEPQIVMAEIARVLKPGGRLFFTVPFLWPLHDTPNDEYRYTPFALTRLLQTAGFDRICVRSLGGWDSSLAQMIGLWVRRRPMSARKRRLLTGLAWPAVFFLSGRDRPSEDFDESCMITGLSGTARKPEFGSSVGAFS